MRLELFGDLPSLGRLRIHDVRAELELLLGTKGVSHVRWERVFFLLSRKDGAYVLDFHNVGPRELLLELVDLLLLVDGGGRLGRACLGSLVGLLELGDDLLLAVKGFLHLLRVGADNLVLLRELRELSAAKEELQRRRSVAARRKAFKRKGSTVYLSFGVLLARNWRDWSCVRTVIGLST